MPYPFFRTLFISLTSLCRFIRHSDLLRLSGLPGICQGGTLRDGGDEIFAATIIIPRACRIVGSISCLEFLKRRRFGAVFYTEIPYLRYRRWFARTALRNDEFYCRHKTTLFNPVCGESLYVRFFETGRRFDDFESAAGLYHEGGDDPLASMEYVDVKTYLPEDILTKVDRASMYHSLEVRNPFLDYRLVELAFRIPSTMKMRHGEKKAILRKAMGDLLPEGVLKQRKMGFAVPLEEWLRNGMREFMFDRFNAPDFACRDWFLRDMPGFW